MERKAQLIIAQIDHLSGEVLGYAVERLMEIGARNINLLPTITKKNRPGNILIIDSEEEAETGIADFLVKELKIAGYHRIDTMHIFQKVSYERKAIRATIDGKSTTFSCDIKLIGDPSKPLSVDIEHDALVRVQKVLQEELKTFVSLNSLRTVIESKIGENGEITIIL